MYLRGSEMFWLEVAIHEPAHARYYMRFWTVRLSGWGLYGMEPLQ
jgi:hypothetical protein